MLLVALEAGIAALLAYVALLVSLARELIRRIPHGVVGLAALGASLPAQLVLPVLQEGAVSYLLWLVVGISLVPAHEKGLELAEARS